MKRDNGCTRQIGLALLVGGLAVLTLSLAGSTMGNLALAQDDCATTVSPNRSLQTAIDQAGTGDTICLEAGTWTTNLDINKSLTLRGTGADESVIKGIVGEQPVLDIESESSIQVSVDGLAATQARDASGIAVGGSAEATIGNVAIERNGNRGIIMHTSAQMTLRDSSVSQNGGEGLLVGESAVATIENSTITVNQRSFLASAGGISIHESAEVTLTDNRIAANASFGVGLFERPCFDTDGTFQGIVRGSANTIPGPDASEGNAEGAVCPSPELDFLMTEDGGEYSGSSDQN